MTWCWRTWWTSLAVLSVLFGLWGLATPLLASPDEPAHYLRATALVRGQVVGADIPGKPAGPALVRVPPGLADAGAHPGCYAFQPEQTADCAPQRTGRGIGGDVVERTQAGRYPPVYYAAVGLPTLARPSLDALPAVRGLSAALCAALLATALTAAASSGRRLLVLGVGVAVSPMVLFLGIAVNPGSVEIAAATALWVTGAVLATTAGRPPRALLAAAGASGLALALARPISPFWLALIGVSLLLLAGRRRVVELARLRSVQAWVGVLVLAALMQTTWVLRTGALDLSGQGLDLPIGERVTGSLQLTGRRAQELVGLFGWLDAPAPTVTVVLWSLAAVGVGAVGLWRAAPGRAALVLALLVACVVLPVALEVRAVAEVGFYWQGRYTLPLAVGVPVLVALASRQALPSRVASALSLLVAGCVVVAHVAAYVVTLARYTVGAGAGLGLVQQVWQPPVPVRVLVPVFALATLAYALWLVRLPLARVLATDHPAG